MSDTKRSPKDSEFDDIMREMEELEKKAHLRNFELIKDPKSFSLEAKPDGSPPFFLKTDKSSDDHLEESSRLESIIGKNLNDLKHPSASREIVPGPLGNQSICDKKEGENPVHGRPSSGMRIHLDGQTELQLCLDAVGLSLKIKVVEGKSLEIETKDGIKFSLPLSPETKKVA
ncbi:MAG: hypothetical protein OXB88_07485 [Bacteriovoracales bacterium]|nr:hypothetical protein [Bacteriovoracales bacterium]